MTGLRARDKIHFFFLNLSRDRDERDNSSPQLEKVKKKYRLAYFAGDVFHFAF